MKYSQQHLFAIIICIIYYYSIFWNSGTSHYWTTGSSVKAISGVTLSAGKFTSLHDLSDILLFFHSNHYIWGRLFYFPVQIIFLLFFFKFKFNSIALIVWDPLPLCTVASLNQDTVANMKTVEPLIPQNNLFGQHGHNVEFTN